MCQDTFYMQTTGGDGSAGGHQCDGANYCTGVSHVVNTTGYNSINISWVFSDCANTYESPNEQLSLEFSCAKELAKPY